MASLILRKLVGTDVVLDDLGLTLVGAIGTEFDLLGQESENVSLSTDTTTAISSLEIIVLDPRDGTTVLSVVDSILAIQNANLTHFGITGGRFADLDAPSYVPTAGKVVVIGSTGDAVEDDIDNILAASGGDAIAKIVDGMLVDGTDTSVVFNETATIIIDGQDETSYDGTAPAGTFVGGDGIIGDPYAPGDTITMSDGSIITVDAVDGNGDVTAFTVTTSGNTTVTPGVALTQVSTSGSGNLFSITPENENISAGTISIEVDDSYLRNDGDTLDSGTLTVASGASIAVATGGNLTLADAPTAPTDATNKAYVDSVAAGMDPKESVRTATIADTGFTYVDNGGVGDTLTQGAAGTTTIDGVLLVDGDRILIKDQTDPLQNGIYVVSDAGAGTATVFTRSEDQDGSPASEVSAGNFTFVEQGTINGATGWVVTGDGLQSLNTDPINWTQTSGVGSYTAGIGLELVGTEFKLDVENLTTDTAVGTDELAFNDVSEGGVTNKTTVAQFIDDMNIVTSAGVGGFSTEVSPGVFANRDLLVSGLGNLDGLAVTNGDGTAGDPIFGLDIQNLPVLASAIDTADRIAVWDTTANANVYYTVGQVSAALAATDSFATWVGAGNFTGDASIAADSSVDTVTLTGGDGINLNLTAATDTVTISLSRAGLVDTAVVGADTVPFFDASATNTPEYRSFTDILTDLDIVNGVVGNGLVVQTAADTYTSRSVVESTTAALQGANVVNGDGVLGNIEVGVDINNLVDNTVDMDATDELIVFDGVNNVSTTGQQVADGVATILGITDLTLSTINGQPVMTFVDTTRANKVLSIDSVVFTWGENKLSNLDWVQVGANASDAASGYIMPLNGTVVYATGHCEDTDANSKDLHLFIDGVDQGSLGSLAGGADAEYVNSTVNFDFTQGQKLRLRAVGAGTGDIEDTVASVFVKWRA